MSDLIMKKFDQFDIKVDLQIPKSIEIVKYKGKKPWEEPLNEEIDRAYLKKLKKKGELVYKLYKKGKLVSDREDGEIHYTYELSDKKLINAYGDEISVSPDNIKIKYHNELTNKFALLPITDSIKKRFHNHGITLNIPRWTEIYIDKWKEPLNEEEEDNELTEKDRKKIKLIYGLFKRGKYTVDDIMYNYVLPDEYWTSNNKETGELIVVLTMDPTQKMKLYAKMRKEDGNIYHREVPVKATQYASLYDDAKKRIKEKFEGFNIEIVF